MSSLCSCNNTIFDIKDEKSKDLEDIYNSSSSISSTQEKLANHFGSSLHNGILRIMATEIDVMKSAAAQNMIDVYHQSQAESWEQFVTNSSLHILRENNKKTFIHLQDYQLQFTQNIYVPLSQYLTSKHILFKGDANYLIQQISAIYNHLKLRKIASNCCMQIDVRCQHDIITCPSDQSNDNKLECNADEAVYEADYNEHEYKKASIIPSEMEAFNISSNNNIDGIMRQCLMPSDADKYCYKRYEVSLQGTEIKLLEALSNNTIPHCAFNNAPLCMIYNSTSSVERILDECCKKNMGLISVSFHVYTDTINVYLYMIDDKGKSFGSRIFEHDLLSMIPKLFENNKVNAIIMNEVNNYLQFKQDSVYKKYYQSLLKQTEEKSSMDEVFENKLDPLFASKLEDIINWSPDFNILTQCFIENKIGFEYFQNHTRKDLMKILKRYNVKTGIAMKIWRAFTGPQSTINDNNNDNGDSIESLMVELREKNQRINDLNRVINIAINNKPDSETDVEDDGKQQKYHDEQQKIIEKYQKRFESFQRKLESKEINIHKKKNKKKNNKSTQNESLINIENVPSYNPLSSRRASRNINISKKMTQEIVPSKFGGDENINWYKYMEKAIAMQLNDYPHHINKDIIVIDYDFADIDKKSEISYYCIIEKHESKGFQYKMHEYLYTEQELKEINNKIEIPESSRNKLKIQFKQIDIMKDLLNEKYSDIMINKKWCDISVFCRKNKKQKIVLKLENEYMNKIINELKHNLNDIDLIPIIMFNNNSHWIEAIWIVRITENVDIGISFKYNNNNNTIKVTGIHLDKQYLMEQHILASPQHIYGCKCFANWISDITDIEICDDLSNNNNKIKDYKQRYDALKTIVHQFIDEMKNDDSFKQKEILRNKSMSSYASGQNVLSSDCVANIYNMDNNHSHQNDRKYYTNYSQ